MKRILICILNMILSLFLVGCGISNLNDSEKFESSEREDIQYKNDLYVQSEIQNYEYLADVTHDGVLESVIVSVGNDYEEVTQVKIQVFNDCQKLLYEDELLIHPNLGGSCYLLSYNGEAYFMHYKPSINHDTASCSYEVFYLNEAGKKIIYDSNEIEISLFDVQELDKDAWKAFAEEENQYFENAFLLVRTYDGVLEYSTNTYKITYTEKFSWLLKDEENDDIDIVLEKFMQETLEN